MKNATKTSSKKLVLNACTLALGAASAVAHAADKPNILVIFGDDVIFACLHSYKHGRCFFIDKSRDFFHGYLFLNDGEFAIDAFTYHEGHC